MSLAVRTAFLAVFALAPAPAPARDATPDATPDARLADALSADAAFARTGYDGVRAAFARHFAATHAAEITAGFGDDHAELTAWLDANADIKEMLYTAIDPDVDQVMPALVLFHDLWKRNPAKVKAFPNVAVAIAVVWDDPRAVYDFRGHQIRTKSVLPDEVMRIGPGDNFDYLTGTSGPLATAVPLLPWEFLVHVVNDRTPIGERDWARANYLRRRAGIGKSYKDVEYDTEMLRTQSQVCKLNGEPYTLPSILEHGGVCAMQADFAARVAKSLVVPAEYVRGESNSGGLHAWVIWVELKSVRRDKITFELMSEGRYQIDQYYVGTLLDPKTGTDTTDRAMERRLATVGTAPEAARQAALLMRAFPIVVKETEMSPADQVRYCGRVVGLFPYAERAWLTVAGIARDGKTISPATAGQLAEKAFKTFGNFPDFSWTVVNDLITPQTDKTYRTRMYELLVARYENLGRPDLACEARLVLADYLVGQKDFKRAATGLAQTVRKFPAEGRYVPRMMAKLRDVCGQFRGGPDLLGKFYLELLPHVPPTRGDTVSEYCVGMYEQAVAFFEQNGMTAEAARVRAALERVRAGRG